MTGPTLVGGCLGSPCALSSGKKKITLRLVCTIQSSHVSVAKLPLENECPPLSLANSLWEIPCLDLFLCHFASVKRSFAISKMVCIFGLSQKDEFMVVVVSFSPRCCLGHLCPLKGWLLPSSPLHEGLEEGCVAPFPQLKLYRYLKSPLGPWPSALRLPQSPGLFRGSACRCSSFPPECGWPPLAWLSSHISPLLTRAARGHFLVTELKTPGQVAVLLRRQVDCMFSEDRPPEKRQPDIPLTLRFKAQAPPM